MLFNAALWARLCLAMLFQWALKAGFHMIATIAMIAAALKKNSSAIVAICGFQMIAAIAEKVNEGRHCSFVAVATIAGEWFPYDRCDHYDRWDRTWSLSQRSLSLRSLWSLESGFHMIAELFFSDRSDRMETSLNKSETAVPSCPRIFKVDRLYACVNAWPLVHVWHCSQCLVV